MLGTVSKIDVEIDSETYDMTLTGEDVDLAPTLMQGNTHPMTVWRLFNKTGTEKDNILHFPKEGKRIIAYYKAP